ncbi:hypothetical protein V6N13_000550 [Hibiscus sabdariffa]|uniref:Uncharacterized protein n=1 Tax=Hibiscus sabdariffa TaxID=183260 RepID=A0ABR2G5N9_9ROSI
MRDFYHIKEQITVYVAILLLMLMMMVPWCTSHCALVSPEKSGSLGFFCCNDLSADYSDMGFDLLGESKTRRMLQQGGGRASTNTLKLNATLFFVRDIQEVYQRQLCER